VVGAWERTALVLDGVPAREIDRAVWVEAGGAFVDVRAVGRDGGTCFAGRSLWASPRFTWAHDIDLTVATEVPDTAVLTVAGDELVERGEHLAGQGGPYEERWGRLSAPGEPVAVLDAPGGLAVRVGVHAAAVWDRRADGDGFVAQYQCRRGTGWVEELSVGDTAGVAALPTPDAAAGWNPTDGWGSRR
jgi:hypothetical protein